MIGKLQLKFFGTNERDSSISNKIEIVKKQIDKLNFYLIIAGTKTSRIDGISAVGMESKSRVKTTLADAEFLLYGPTADFRYELPLLKAGVTPALISHVCAKLINANVVVVPIGIGQAPYFNHLKVEEENSMPSECLSTGKAMPINRVSTLFKKGFAIGFSSENPLFISESVPGGTTTAQAVMEGIGFDVSHLIGSSLIKPPRKLKRKIIDMGIANANLTESCDSIDIISSLGDPFQAFCLGLLIGARKGDQTVILSGGSQMIALLALALEYINSSDKKMFAERVFISTTNWLVRDNKLNILLNLVARKHNVSLIGIGSCLNFRSSRYNQLNVFEKGYVKEGVGAGGFSMLAYLKGYDYEDIISNCEYNLERMLEVSQIVRSEFKK